jgi:hypothetical protein
MRIRARKKTRWMRRSQLEVGEDENQGEEEDEMDEEHSAVRSPAQSRMVGLPAVLGMPDRH